MPVMKIHITKPLFAWDCLETTPVLKTVKTFFEALPDSRLLNALHRYRGKGRNDYPVKVLWSVYLLRILFRHPTMTAMLEELHRNPALCHLIGIDNENQIPRKYNMSRFEEVLGMDIHLPYLMDIFPMMVRLLASEVKDLGKNSAGDASALHAHKSRSKNKTDSKLPLPSGGKKEYKDDNGTVTEVYEWFGYKFHLIVDVKHEVAIAYDVTTANQAEPTVMNVLVEQAIRNLHDSKQTARQGKVVNKRIKMLSYDKAADSADIHEFLNDRGIKPVIEVRNMWADGETERLFKFDDGNSNIVYDEAGTVYCYDKVSNPPVRHKMSFIGFEPSRGTLKYRCPAAHEGWDCPSFKRCNKAKKYGLTKRVKSEIDFRRFCPLPRDTKKFEKLYKKRTAVERTNGRLKLFWGTDDGNVNGPQRFHARLNAVMIVHIMLAFLLASCPKWEGTLNKTRLSPIAKALKNKLPAKDDSS